MVQSVPTGTGVPIGDGGLQPNRSGSISEGTCGSDGPLGLLLHKVKRPAGVGGALLGTTGRRDNLISIYVICGRSSGPLSAAGAEPG